MREVTNYFRAAVLAAGQISIDYKTTDYQMLSWQDILDGRISADVTNKLWKKTKKNGKKEDDGLQVVLALKTISTDYRDGGQSDNKIAELTSILFLPAILHEDGRLIRKEKAMPWITREYLVPMIDSKLALGEMNDYDTFFEDTVGKRGLIESWNDYLMYATEMYEYVVKTKFSENKIEHLNLQTDGKYYIFEMDMVNSTYHILNCYTYLSQNKTEPLLYQNVTNKQLVTLRSIPDKFQKKKMMRHSGQMNGEYPLSPSQREAISCFQDIKEGEVLTVSGPPGTGKTTLLQTVVANMYVEAAIKEEQAPVIIATSTNNQAVTNIIESFGKINAIGLGDIEDWWITGVHSFALYFPAASKQEEAERKHYQYTDVFGTKFVEALEDEENRKKSKEKFQEKYNHFFSKQNKNNDSIVQSIHSELKEINIRRCQCVEKIVDISEILREKTSGEYLQDIEQELLRIDYEYKQTEERREYLIQRGYDMQERCIQWRESYHNLCWIIRFFQFLPVCKRRIISWSYTNMKQEELNFLNRGMNIAQIEEEYRRQIDANDKCIEKTRDQMDRLLHERNGYIEKQKIICDKLKNIQNMIQWFERYSVRVSDELIWNKFKLEKLNDALDKVRYVEFWMAVHYYEARWLEEKCTITMKQKNTNYENVLYRRYHRTAMITPCMVMTCHMLPKQFLAYDTVPKYMFEFADLLIVDEAGQISTEIGATAFAFAKRAIVVGDKEQIPPVWGVTRALDITFALDNNVIQNRKDFKRLESLELNCSQASILGMTSNACPYKKYERGLFLSEHRRCYDEIIQYCNDLVYKGRLEPLRGSAEKASSNVLRGYLPPMGHKQIDSEYSQKAGTSRKNEKEAEEIIEWIKKNYEKLCLLYKNETERKGDEFNITSVLGIITPFKAQSSEIKRKLKKRLPEMEQYITVGTVHTFQGAERKVIIFSSVYGDTDECFFINHNKSLMNVAVSRAKDSFLIFGERGSLRGGKCSEMLKEATKEEIE